MRHGCRGETCSSKILRALFFSLLFSSSDSGDEDTPDAAFSARELVCWSLQEEAHGTANGSGDGASVRSKPQPQQPKRKSGARKKESDVVDWTATRVRALKAMSQLQRQSKEEGAIAGSFKKKTGYQLFHMYRVAELKESTPGGIKHHDAFKRAAREWTSLSLSDHEFYNSVMARARRVFV